MRGEVFLVYLRFGESRGTAPFEKLRKLARRWFPLAVQRIVIVDNAITFDLEREVRRNVDLISGDNVEREFTGYEKGLQFLQRRYGMRASSPVIVANDTFLSSYGGGKFLKDFTLANVHVGLALGALVGHVDAYPEPVGWDGKKFQKWVRTSLMVTRWETLQALLPLSLPYEDKELFAAKDGFFAKNAPPDETYREYLETWLFRDPKEGSTFRESWHSKEKLDKRSRDRLRAKARCIFCEHQLSLRAQEKKIPLFDPRQPLKGIGRAIGLDRTPLPGLVRRVSGIAHRLR